MHTNNKTTSLLPTTSPSSSPPSKPQPKRGMSILVVIVFICIVGTSLLLFYRPIYLHMNYHSQHDHDHDNNNDVEDTSEENRKSSSSVSSEDSSKIIQISNLQKKLETCEESIEMIKSSSSSVVRNNNNDKKDHISNSLIIFCSSSQLSDKCSGHGACFDPASRQQKKKSVSGNKNNNNEKEEQKKLVNSFGISSIQSRREQQLRPGSCVCDEGFGGKDCSVRLSINNKNDNDVGMNRKSISQEEAEKLITVVVPNSHSAFQEHDDADEESSEFVTKLKKEAKHIEVFHHRHSSSKGSKASPKEEIISLNKMIADHCLSSSAAETHRPFLLILGPDVDFSNFDLWRANLPMMIDQMLTTDVDFLGMMTIEHQKENSNNIHHKIMNKKQKKHSASGDDAVFDPYCYDLVYHAWRLRHKKAPFGYERHQDFTMFCDRPSNTFMMRKSMLKMKMKSSSSSDPISLALNKTLIGASSNSIWPLCSFADDNNGGNKNCNLFESSLGTAAWIDLFLRIKRLNRAFISKTIISQEDSNNNNNNIHHIQSSPKFLIGSCAECIIDIVDRNHFLEPLTPTFAEKHQIEVYFDAFGRRSKIVCTKSGGIYGHSNKGLYAPLCHRLMRQRDFLWLSKLWIHGTLSSSNIYKEDSDETDSDDGEHENNQKYSVSVHHGNLFGALRYQEELLWETDGDFDMICHDCSHTELMQRFDQLVKIASAKPSEKIATSLLLNNDNKKKRKSKPTMMKINGGGFETIVTYPEKPWYVAFKKEKTDFQLNARSPLSKQTRGKPQSQVHNVSVPYQGLRVHMNGFSNPWRGIRSDPGHDYRDLYLAQQGWVLHFTKNSVACSIEGHNACLPNCRKASWYLFDHEYCNDIDDGEERRGSIFANAFDRDPILWFDEESDVMFRERIPESKHYRYHHESDNNNNNNNNNNLIMNEEELFEVARGETKKWMKNKLWQYL